MDKTLFQSLTKTKKIDFFVKCQELLLAHHPKSEFLFTHGNLDSKIQHIKDLAANYQGYVHVGDNICMLFNKINIKDTNDLITALKDNMYKPPKDDFNAMAIDFVVFRKLEDCLDFVKSNYDANIRHIMYIKNNKPKIYETTKFVSNILHIPIASR